MLYSRSAGKSIVFCALLLTAFVYGSPFAHAQQQTPPSLVITPFVLPETDGQRDDMQTLEEILRIAIGNTGKYAVMPSRALVIRAVLDELDIRHPANTVEDRAKAIGAAVNAEYVLLSQMRTLGNMNMLVMQIYDAKDGRLVAGEVLNYRAMEDAVEQLLPLAVKLADSAPAPTPPAAPVEPIAAQAAPTSDAPAIAAVGDVAGPRRNESYFSMRWLLPMLEDETLSGLAANFEYGRISQNGLLWSVDFGGGAAAAGGRFGDAFTVGVSFNLARANYVDFSNDLQYTLGGTLGLWYTQVRYESQGVYVGVRDHGIVGPFARTRYKNMEITYRGLIGHREVIAGVTGVEDAPLVKTSDLAYTNQLMIGYRFGWERAEPSQEYRNFSGGQRFGTWALNWLIPGLGSFSIMKDRIGGWTQLGLVAAGYVFVLNGIDEVEVDHGWYTTTRQETNALYSIGMLALGINFGFNIYRSITYDKPQPQTALGNNNGLRFGALPDRNGNLQAVAIYDREF